MVSAGGGTVDQRALSTSAFVDNQLGVYRRPPVVGPFSPRQEQHHDQRDDGDDASRGGSDARILDGLGEGIEPREAGLGRHCVVGWVSAARGRLASSDGSYLAAAAERAASRWIEMPRRWKFGGWPGWVLRGERGRGARLETREA